jgi:hypothetical protein
MQRKLNPPCFRHLPLSSGEHPQNLSSVFRFFASDSHKGALVGLAPFHQSASGWRLVRWPVIFYFPLKRKQS